MALLWLEGFEGYGTTTGTNVNVQMRRRYATYNVSSYWYICAGRYGGYGGQGNGNYYAGTPALTTDDTIVYGCALTPALLGYLTYSEYFLQLMDGTTQGIGCKVDHEVGEIEVFRGTTKIGQTSGADITNGWVYIEVKVKCHNTEGSVEIRVNGQTKLSLTNIDTQAGSNSYYDICRVYLCRYCYLDDVYILDSTGSVCNDFLGPQKIVGLFPEADTGTVQWTPSSGTDHYALVDETIDNDDSDYVEDSTSGHVDLYDYPSLSGIDNVKGLQVNTTAILTDSTPYSLVTQVKSGSTASDDGGQEASESWIGYVRTMETDPDTSNPWTVSGVNGLQAGIKVA